MTAIRYICFGLSLVGLAISVYLTIAHFTSSSILACPNTGTINCAKVTTSAQSYFLKVPVAIWGFVYYLYLSSDFLDLLRYRICQILDITFVEIRSRDLRYLDRF